MAIKIDTKGLLEKADREAQGEAAKTPEARAAERPSPGRAKAEAARRAARDLGPRVQLNFPYVPEKIRDQFRRAAKERGFRHPVHYLYHLMRLDGLDVPAPEDMDSRRGWD